MDSNDLWAYILYGILYLRVFFYKENTVRLTIKHKTKRRLVRIRVSNRRQFIKMRKLLHITGG